MPISYPVDFLLSWPGWETEFKLMHRNEVSRQAGGATRVKDMGTALWRGQWETKTLQPNAFDYWQAMLETLEDGAGTFYGFKLARRWPSAHANGTGVPGSVTVGTIADDRASLSLSGASGLTLNIGDMISVGTGLYRCVQGSVNGAAFGVRPYLLPDADSGNAVRVGNPRCLMRMEPKSLQATVDKGTGNGTLAFAAWQSL